MGASLFCSDMRPRSSWFVASPLGARIMEPGAHFSDHAELDIRDCAQSMYQYACMYVPLISQ